MMPEFRSARAAPAMTYAEFDGAWASRKNPRWIRAWSHSAVASCITESTLVITSACMTRGSRTISPQDRWKKFLSLISDTAG
jgi:hypothetical protein